MGFCIETKNDDSFNKAQYFIDNHDAKRIMQDDVPELLKAGIGVISIVHTPMWEAAAFCYDIREFIRFTDLHDSRYKEWLSMDREWLEVESGYRAKMEEDAELQEMRNDVGEDV